MRFFRFRRRIIPQEISPEEILIDARNLPAYQTGQSDGRINKPIEVRTLRFFIALLCLTGVGVLYQTAQLMIVEGDSFRALAENNRFGSSLIIPERGLIFDRTGERIVSNLPHVGEDEVYEEYYDRAYADVRGVSHVLGYVQMPRRDGKGLFYRSQIEGVTGVEDAYNAVLRGEPGARIVETDARMARTGGGVLRPSVPGANVHLTIDARLQQAMFDAIQSLADDIPFYGGAGVVMDVRTGEILVLTNYPEYNPNALIAGDRELIARYSTDERTPYLNRAVSGQYTPGSIIKPFVAMAALNEGIVTPRTNFVSTGSLRLANPYHQGQYSVFTDWRAHGVVDLRRALAVSSNIYFYHVGGGFGEQEGLGIARIETYMRMFGFGSPTGFALSGELLGVVPSPEWKAEQFPEDPIWRIGNTYHTSIGQYGFLVTPLQVVRAVGSIANGGILLTPRIEVQNTAYGARTITLPEEYFGVVRAGMRDAVTEGTAIGLNVPYVAVAGKTGTAEIGAGKDYVHSWATGFYPYENPRYAFVVLMEHGPRTNLMGATSVMRTFLDWVHEHAPEYLATDS